MSSKQPNNPIIVKSVVSSSHTAQQNAQAPAAKSKRSKPLGYYSIKDRIIDIISRQSFIDALLISVAFTSMFFVLPFYPLYAFIILLIVVFAATLIHPFLGLIVYIAVIFPMFMYQVPVLAWLFIMVATAILVIGYMHYRTILFIFIIFSLAFSPLGYLFIIPIFLYSVLVLSNKRAIIAMLTAVFAIIIFSAISGISNAAYILYNTSQAHTYISNGFGSIVLLDAPSKPIINNIFAGFASAAGSFSSGSVIAAVPNSFGAVALSTLVGSFGYIVEILVLILAIMLIDWYAANSKSKLNGTLAAAFGVIYPAFYIMVAYNNPIYSSIPLVFPFVSYLLGILVIFVFEYSGIEIVKVKEVKKQDIRMKFGEAFEDLSVGSTSEIFENIGNYEQTKKELKEAIMLPLEEKGISRAYNIKPSKGVLLFGPPGTGKTLLMRALSNELHAGFYYVKASDLISAYPGESEKKINKIFSIARKNAPCILFIDEIDNVATSREQEADEIRRHALSQFLIEMDGFKVVNKVVVVGATNRPDMLDSAILRPGRFDKLIYVPIPDAAGRKEIFEKYLRNLPISDNINLDEIAAKSDRYSGADIKAVVESIAQSVASDALLHHKVLSITQNDILSAIAATKPSTSLAQIDKYLQFKLDYERSMHHELRKVEKDVMLDDVIGLEDAKKAIREAIEIPLLHPTLMKKYGIKPINGLLLFGPPGNGKTMLMRAVKNEFEGLTMIEISGAELSEQGIERANATIKETFNRAQENAPSIIFIDEIDSIFSKREGASEIMIQITSQLLEEIDGIRKTNNIVVVGATNRPDMLDSAILRPGRFDKLIYVEPPNVSNRSSLFRKYLQDVPIIPNIDYDKLAAMSEGFTGADISNVCREAKTEAMEHEISTGTETPITIENIISIIQNTKPSAPIDLIKRYITFISRYGRV
ncbi:MAG: AAA family ATPase [Candidatus Marsarchaeota archaeon]|jgi:SpoVK/Ycf46/Vps4 family AAA+-type ATPase|nr:AAA family ATPase [Candidatus Marsarchaeota archaeon]